jgi:hypothetical protein
VLSVPVVVVIVVAVAIAVATSSLSPSSSPLSPVVAVAIAVAYVIVVAIIVAIVVAVTIPSPPPCLFDCYISTTAAVAIVVISLPAPPLCANMSANRHADTTPTQRPASQHGAMSPTWSVSYRRHGADMSACLSFLLRNRNASAREAMLVAEFPKDHVNDLSMRKAISCSFVKVLQALVPPTTIVQHERTSLDLSPLTADTVVTSTTTAACLPTTNDAITIPLPKRKKQRTTASMLEKKRVDDLKMKKHKAAVH